MNERREEHGEMNRLALTSPQAAFEAAGAVPWTASALQERFLTDVYRYVYRRLPHVQEAEDVTAEVFAAAFQALPKFRGSSSPYAWLLGIARRKIADALRRRSRRKETLVTDFVADDTGSNPFFNVASPEEEGPQATMERTEAHATMRRIVGGLKEEQREALLLQYVEGLAVAEIATVMQRSPQAINSLLQRARASIFREGKGYFLNQSEVQR
jgi:RNA polymerase sigma-70 factor, ECF subfamily